MSLVLRDIRHRFGSTLVIDGASITAGAGEIVCLHGPSGCGKTTLLRIAAGLERLQEGAVEIDGVTLATPHRDTPPEKRPIGFVFQDFVLFPHLTIVKNVAFGLADLSPVERATRIDEELAAVDLGGLKDRFPHQLSGGQQQRAALARAFARRPRAMLLDEPFASIDVTLRQRLRADMRRLLKARSAPAILVTHDATEAIELGDRIAIMRGGRIVETASPKTLFHSPRTAAGAAIFPGSQTLPCRAVEGGVETVFGRIAPLRRPDDATVVVVQDSGATATKGTDFEVVDCRFAGPHWQLTIEAKETLLRAIAPAMVDGKASVAFDPARARAFGPLAGDGQ